MTCTAAPSDKKKRHCRKLQKSFDSAATYTDPSQHVTTVGAQRRQLERKHERLTRLQIERGGITKAYATALRKVHWPHLLGVMMRHAAAATSGMRYYIRPQTSARWATDSGT